MPQFNARGEEGLKRRAETDKLCRDCGREIVFRSSGMPIALNLYLMFVNEFVFSFSLLSFAGLLCLLGVVILADGLVRLVAEWRRRLQPKKVTPTTQGEAVTTLQRTA